MAHAENVPIGSRGCIAYLYNQIKNQREECSHTTLVPTVENHVYTLLTPHPAPDQLLVTGIYITNPSTAKTIVTVYEGDTPLFPVLVGGNETVIMNLTLGIRFGAGLSLKASFSSIIAANKPTILVVGQHD
jgi:hypothetical protein